MKKLSLLFAALLAVSMSFATTVTKTVESLATELSWTNSTVCTPFALDNAITVSTTATDANTGKYFSNGQQIRLYQTGCATITLTAGEGYSISSVALTYASQNTGILLDATGATYESGTDFAVNAQAVTFSVGNSGEATNGQARITEFSVTYNAGGETPVIPVDTTVVPVDTTVVPVDTTTIVYNTCADVNAVTANTNMTLGEVTVVYAKGTHIYVKDATATTLVYTTKYSTLKAGDRVSGIAGQAKLYRGLPELAATTELADLVITEGEAPVIFDAQAAPTAANINQVMMFRGVQMPTASFTTTYATNITGIFAGEEVAFRNNWKEAYDFDSTQIYNILGCVAIYNSTIQVYAAQIIEKPELYPVAFLDWDGTVLTRDSIARGAAATAPAAPVREGYEFLGWSKDYSNIQGEMFIIALYEQEQAPVEGILVSYIDGVDNSLIGNDTIVLNIPEAPIHEGYTFQGWMTVVGNPEDGITIQAKYQNNDPTQVQQQTYVPEAGETRKVFENGKVYVVRDGKTFTMQGQEVR